MCWICNELGCFRIHILEVSNYFNIFFEGNYFNIFITMGRKIP